MPSLYARRRKIHTTVTVKGKKYSADYRYERTFDTYEEAQKHRMKDPYGSQIVKGKDGKYNYYVDDRKGKVRYGSP